MVFLRTLGGVLILTLWLYPTASRAGDVCDNPRGPNELLQCALTQDPEVQRHSLQVDRDGSLKKQAGQRPNPEFIYETTFGSPEFETDLEGEFFLGYPFELGGKRKARMNRADAVKGVSETQFRLVQEQVVLKTVLNLYRLRQISTEIAKIQEALKTFRQVEGQYRARGILTPEQEVSLNIFQLAAQDYEIQKTGLLQERMVRLNALKTATGLSESVIMGCLPKGTLRLPKMGERAELDAVNVSNAQQELRLAQSKEKEAAAAGYPDLTVGPLIKFQDSNQAGWGYGFGLALPLPLLNRNQGGKEVANKDRVLAERNLSLTRRAAKLNRAELEEIYRMAVKRLTHSLKIKEAERRHHRLHDHFFRGLVETSLVVEAHRQLVDLTRDRNKLELEAIASLWSLYALEGRILTEKI